jgi:hypothetical protein
MPSLFRGLSIYTVGCSVRVGTSGLTVTTAFRRSSTTCLMLAACSLEYAKTILHTWGPVFSPICLISSSCLSVAFCASSSAFLLPLVCCLLSADVRGHMLFVVPRSVGDEKHIARRSAVVRFTSVSNVLNSESFCVL